MPEKDKSICEICGEKMIQKHSDNYGGFDYYQCTGEKHKKGSKYWYFTYIEECVLCGGGETRRERRYTPKPENIEDRFSYTQFAHDHHFF